MRRTTGILLATTTLLTLSACTVGSQPGCEPLVPVGGLADSVVLHGGFDDFPADAEFPTPLVVDEARRAVLAPGDGRTVAPSDAVSARITMFDGGTGTPVDGGEILLFANDADLPMFAAAACAPVGSRVATVAPAADLLGGYAMNFGLSPEQTVVAVLDIQDAVPGRVPSGAVHAVEGLPAVAIAPNGRPGLTFTGAPAPTELTVATLVEGDGDVVAAGDTIIVNYTGVEWETREVFDSSWTRGRPHAFNLDDVVPGFQEAVIGARTGSRIMVAIPPSDGYGDGPGSPVGPDATMLFVIDLLGIDRGAEAAPAS